MKTLNIKTCTMSSSRNSHHFFILSKGYNAGKPLEKPCPNCFIVTADSEEHKYQLFWICYSLWKSGSYLPLLCGSVIPFLHIRDAAIEIENAFERNTNNRVEFDNHVRSLQQLVKAEKLLHTQLQLINETKSALARRIAMRPVK